MDSGGAGDLQEQRTHAVDATTRTRRCHHKTWRAEVGCELPPAPPALGELERHIAWVSREYNRSGRTPPIC